jgi:hypothetical protein
LLHVVLGKLKAGGAEEKRLWVSQQNKSTGEGSKLFQQQSIRKEKRQ